MTTDHKCMTKDDMRVNYKLGNESMSVALMGELFGSLQEKGYSSIAIRKTATYLLVNVYNRLPADEIEKAIKCDSNKIISVMDWILPRIKNFIKIHGCDYRECVLDEDGYYVRPENAAQKIEE